MRYCVRMNVCRGNVLDTFETMTACFALLYFVRIYSFLYVVRFTFSLCILTFNSCFQFMFLFSMMKNHGWKNLVTVPCAELTQSYQQAARSLLKTWIRKSSQSAHTNEILSHREFAHCRFTQMNYPVGKLLTLPFSFTSLMKQRTCIPGS